MAEESIRPTSKYWGKTSDSEVMIPFCRYGISVSFFYIIYKIAKSFSGYINLPCSIQSISSDLLFSVQPG